MKQIQSPPHPPQVPKICRWYSRWCPPYLLLNPINFEISITVLHLVNQLTGTANCRSGWWYTYPSETYESQLGWWFPIYGKIKAMFQTTNQRWFTFDLHVAKHGFDMLRYPEHRLGSTPTAVATPSATPVATGLVGKMWCNLRRLRGRSPLGAVNTHSWAVIQVVRSRYEHTCPIDLR